MLLLVVYVNDLLEGTRSYVSTFAEDTKLMAAVVNVKDCEILQWEPDAPASWQDRSVSCSGNGQGTRWRAGESDCEKDLGILILVFNTGHLPFQQPVSAPFQLSVLPVSWHHLFFFSLYSYQSRNMCIPVVSKHKRRVWHLSSGQTCPSIFSLLVVWFCRHLWSCESWMRH